MATLSDGDWLRVRAAYCGSAEPVRRIAERFGTTTAALYRRARREAWPQRRSGEDKVSDLPQGPDRATMDAPASDRIVRAERGELIRRFYGLIDLKLGQMEADMAGRDERTPQDNERDTRALGTLIRNFEKVFGLEREEVGDGGTRRRADTKPRDAEAEAAALRRELAARLVRLRKANARDGRRTVGGAE